MRSWGRPSTWIRHVVGVRVTRESEYRAADVDSMLAHLAIEDDKGPHGIPMSRATAKGAKFIASPIPTTDLAAKALHRAQKKHYTEFPNEDRSADLWSVEEVAQ